MDWSTNAACQAALDQGAASISCFVPLFQNVVTALVALVGVVLFVMLVIGGFSFLFSGGDQKQLEKAKHTLTYAVGGLILFLSAYIILSLIKTFTGVDVTTFNINIAP